MPLARVWVAALVTYGVALALNGQHVFASPGRSALFWFFAGGLYTHLFEYAYHRVAMHAGVKYLEFVKRSHSEHHRAFYGDHFTSRRREDLEHIASLWYVFPSLFVVHYLPLALLLSSAALILFFTGVTVHYLVFETTHWFTHVEGNAFDRAIGRIPVLGAVRRFQVRHHRIHHEIPDADFNFNPPFLGDLLFGTWRTPPSS